MVRKNLIQKIVPLNGSYINYGDDMSLPEGAFSSSSNLMTYADGAIGNRCPYYTDNLHTSATGKIYFMTSAKFSSTTYLIYNYSADNKFYRATQTSGVFGSATEISATAYANANIKPFCWTMMNNVLVISGGGLSAPLKYDGSSLASLGGSPPNFRWSVEAWEFLFVSGQTTNPEYVYISAWTGSPASPSIEGWNTASDDCRMRVDFGDGDLPTGGIFVNGSLYIFKYRSLHQYSYSGGDVTKPTQGLSRVKLFDIGCCSHWTIKSTPYGLIWFDGKKVYLWNYDTGTLPQCISYGIDFIKGAAVYDTALGYLVDATARYDEANGRYELIVRTASGTWKVWECKILQTGNGLSTAWHPSSLSYPQSINFSRTATGSWDNDWVVAGNSNDGTNAEVIKFPANLDESSLCNKIIRFNSDATKTFATPETWTFTTYYFVAVAGTAETVANWSASGYTRSIPLKDLGLLDKYSIEYLRIRGMLGGLQGSRCKFTFGYLTDDEAVSTKTIDEYLTGDNGQILDKTYYIRGSYVKERLKFYLATDTECDIDTQYKINFIEVGLKQVGGV